MKRLVVAIAAVAALTLSAGALAAASLSGRFQTKVSSGQLKGTWTLSFSKKGTYTVKGPLGSAAGKNTYSGSTITFGRETGASACAPGATGKYGFKLSGKTLKLTKKSDPCGPRASILTRKLTKIG
jgi:hypothetical protein